MTTATAPGPVAAEQDKADERLRELAQTAREEVAKGDKPLAAPSATTARLE